MTFILGADLSRVFGQLVDVLDGNKGAPTVVFGASSVFLWPVNYSP